MKILFWSLVIVMAITLVFLTISLTSNNPSSDPLKEYRFLTVIFFIAMGGFVRKLYKITYDKNK